MLISTAICTQGRSPFLMQAIGSVLGQEPPSGGVRLILQDDGCPEEARARLSALAEGDERVLLARSEGKGLSRARNRAAELCRGGILAFLDDDARMGAGYLQCLEDFFARRENAAAVGGKVLAQVQGLAPPWFSGAMWAWANGLDLGAARALRYPDFVYGTNMAFRVSALERAGGFDERLGRKGDGMLDCEEAELFLRMEKLKMAVYYEPGLRVVHTLAAERLSRAAFRDKAYAHGRSCALIDSIHGRSRGLAGALAPALAAAARHLVPPFSPPFSQKLLIDHARGYLSQALSID